MLVKIILIKGEKFRVFFLICVCYCFLFGKVDKLYVYVFINIFNGKYF